MFEYYFEAAPPRVHTEGTLPCGARRTIVPQSRTAKLSKAKTTWGTIAEQPSSQTGDFPLPSVAACNCELQGTYSGLQIYSSSTSFLQATVMSSPQIGPKTKDKPENKSQTQTLTTRRCGGVYSQYTSAVHQPAEIKRLESLAPLYPAVPERCVGHLS